MASRAPSPTNATPFCWKTGLKGISGGSEAGAAVTAPDSYLIPIIKQRRRERGREIALEGEGARSGALPNNSGEWGAGLLPTDGSELDCWRLLPVLSLSINEIHPWALLLMSTRAALHGGEQFPSAGPRIQAGEGETQSLCFIGGMLVETVGFGALCELEEVDSYPNLPLMQPLMLFVNVPSPSGGFCLIIPK